MPHFHRYHAFDLGWGGWLLWTLITIAFWALVIALIVMIVRSFRHPSGARLGPPYGQPPVAPYGHDPSSPEAILAQRFARGEIDTDEYHARLATLRGGPPASGGAQSVGD